MRPAQSGAKQAQETQQRLFVARTVTSKMNLNDPIDIHGHVIIDDDADDVIMRV